MTRLNTWLCKPWTLLFSEFVLDVTCTSSCITFNNVGTLTTVNGNINTAKYIKILEDNIWPVIVRHYPEENYIFQDDNAPVHGATVRRTSSFIINKYGRRRTTSKLNMHF
jgi:hypothetical protein